MMASGGLLAIATAILPPTAEGSDIPVALVGIVCIALGGLLVRSAVPISELQLGLLLALGSIVITVATSSGGPGNGTQDNEILYLWICLGAFNFVSPRHAYAQLGIVAVAYGWLLIHTGAPDAGTRWIVTISTLSVAGALISNLRSSRETLFAELSERATHDALTGVLNRGGLEARAAVELARSRRFNEPVSVLMVDIDEFKRLNDTLGHDAGDVVLRRLAEVLDASTRDIDVIARTGGDEFAILLPATATAHARLVAERVAGEAHHSYDGPDFTVSVGAATGTAAASSFLELSRAADTAMYEAKRAGGNQVSSLAGHAAAPYD